MATSYMDYTLPTTQFTYDVNQNQLFKKDENNYINSLSIKQLNTLGNASLLDIYLSTGNVVEPHIHQNATELVYCISGSAVVSLINPFTNELLNFPISPGQVANVPQGWWHYEVATVDQTHLLAIFDAPVPEAIFGSDILRLTPASVLAHTYCLDENKVKETFAPIQKTVFIGPPADCATQVSPATDNMPKPNSQPNVQPNIQPNVQPYVQMQYVPSPEYIYPDPMNPTYGYNPNAAYVPTESDYMPYTVQRPIIGNGWRY
ncbi:cupin domain-containing protein [Paenibacillus illinoisensis]|uniref:Cupin domain-containing protein n=1 Tax=Paenibacillus illinoisensis TaxID=59845 RepID=A0ABW8HY73_9BACL